MDEYFCPHCGAILNYQSGFSPDCGAWRCTECGEMLMDDDVYEGENYEGVAWFCDGCGALLNKQSGFSDAYGSWTCTECGYYNGITDDDIINNDDDDDEYSSSSGIKCPSCGADLEEQGLCGYESVWECAECNSNLFRKYSFDEFEVIEGILLKCPKCDSIINKQCGFCGYEEEWECEECNTKLKRDDSISEFEIINDNNSYEEDYYDDSNDDDDDYDNDYEEDNNIEKESQIHLKSNENKNENNISILGKIKQVAKKIFNGYKTKINYDSSELIGKNVDDIIRGLKDKGFTNIHKQAIQDIYIDNLKEVNSIERVVVDEKIDFSKNDVFSYDSKIFITYHTKKKLVIPFTSREVHGKNVKDIEKMLKDIGFINIELKEINDLVIGFLIKNGSIEDVGINHNVLYKRASFHEYDSKIEIRYHTFPKKIK